MANIKLQLFNGVFYTAIARYAGIFIQLAVVAILARLLSPSEFGTVAICTVVMTFFNQLTEIGIGIAVIQRQDLNKNDHEQLYSFTVYFAFILCFLFCLIAYPIGTWYKNVELTGYLQILSAQLLFGTMNMIPNALLLKEKRFKFIAARTLSLQIISGCSACIVAYLGGGVYSLFITPIVTNIGTYIINMYQVRLKFHFNFSLSPLKKVFSYSFYSFMFGFVNYFSRNLDKLLTGKYLSMNLLGYYEKSYRLVMLPMQNITGVINPVVQPMLAEYQNDRQRLGSYLMRILKMLNMICFPLSILAFFCSTEIIILLFGKSWYGAIPCFKILSISIGLQAAVHITGVFYQVANSTKQLFWCGLLAAVENVAAFIVAIEFWKSIEAVAIAVTTVFFLSFFQNYFVLFHYIYKGMLRRFFKEILLPFTISGIMIIVLYPLSCIDFPSLWVSGLCKVIVFVLVLIASFHVSAFCKLSDIKAFLNSRFGKSKHNE